MDELDADGGQASSGEQGVVFADAVSGRAEVDFGRFTEDGDEIECDLGVVDFPGQILEREQGYGLLMELVHGGAAMFGSRLKDRRPGTADRGSIFDAREQQGEATAAG